MSRFYFYKLTEDNNGAPCLDESNTLLSLAICKPAIRRTANRGDLIFGFAANSLHDDNRLIYIACITKKLVNGDYYTDPQYFTREDCIYRWDKDHYYWNPGSVHHGDGYLNHDIGFQPNYKRANVLLSADFRYFGEYGNDDYKNQFPAVKLAVENLGIGHRVNHDNQLKIQLQELKNITWNETPQVISRSQTSKEYQGVCHRKGSCGVI